jgi:hypothetical protein
MRRPVYDGVAVDESFEAAVARLSDEPATWLPEPAEPRPSGTVVRMHANGLLAATGVLALVDAGPVELDPPGLAVRPIAWRALVADRVFPRLVGELELSATSDTTSRLTLVGGYQPPVSVVGDAADRLVGHHVAEAVIRTFLEQVAARMSHHPEVASPGP